MCPRTGPSVVLSREYLYVTGGFYWAFHGSANFNDMHVYSIEDHHWENVRVPRFSAALTGNTDDDITTWEGPMSASHDAFDVSARLKAAGEYGSDVPMPFTMASLVSWPASPDHASVTSRGQGPRAVGTQWLLFGGRLGDHPTGAQYRVRIFEPWRSLKWLAASYVSNSPAIIGSNASITNRCMSMVKYFEKPHVFSVIVPIRLPAHDVMETLFEGANPDDLELDDVIEPTELGTPQSSTGDGNEDDEMWDDVDEEDDEFDDGDGLEDGGN
jgi:hypothetical protein